MRTENQIKNEIKKLRLVLNNKNFNQHSKNNAWAMMLALQWILMRDLDSDTRCLTPMELSGITIDQSNMIKKMAKRN